jgi:hypothetical protein
LQAPTSFTDVPGLDAAVRTVVNALLTKADGPW